MLYTNQETEQMLKFAKSLKKSLSIKYTSCSKDDKFIYLRFEVSTKNLNEDKAEVYVDELDSFINDTAVPRTQIVISKNKNVGITLKFDKDKDFTETFYDDGNVFQATITCDGLSAKSEEFKLNFGKETSLNKCFCNRDFTVKDVKKIVKELRDNTFYNKKSISFYHGDKLFYKEPLLSENEKNNFEIFTWVLNQMFDKFKINTCIRKINFLAQMYPETQFFTDLSENNPAPNLGKYYGRGFIQLTHKGDEDVRTKNATSYLGYGKYSNLDVINNPDLLCKSLSIASDSGGWFWRYGKRLNNGSIKDLNTLADIDDANEISRLVNGGENARKERLEANKQLKKIFNYEECINKK